MRKTVDTRPLFLFGRKRAPRAYKGLGTRLVRYVINNLLHLVIVKYGVLSLVLCISTRLRLVTILMLLVKYLIILFHAAPCNKSYVFDCACSKIIFGSLKRCTDYLPLGIFNSTIIRELKPTYDTRIIHFYYTLDHLCMVKKRSLSNEKLKQTELQDKTRKR